jgi:hypothetical protein
MTIGPTPVIGRRSCPFRQLGDVTTLRHVFINLPQIKFDLYYYMHMHLKGKGLARLFANFGKLLTHGINGLFVGLLGAGFLENGRSGDHHVHTSLGN